MANPLYGQNKFDDKLTVKGRLVKNGGVPAQDSNGIAPVGGTIMPPRWSMNGAVVDSISLKFSGLFSSKSKS